MQNKKAFTIIELLVCLAILSSFIAVVVTMMTRGASNVQRGSFNALAANQAFWIVSVMRNDITRAVEDIIFEPSDNNEWKGNTDFKVHIEGGMVNYVVEKRGDRKKFIRKFTPISGDTAFSVPDSRVQSFGDEYMTDMTVTLTEDNSYMISIEMTDTKSSSKEKKIVWKASIYPPLPNGINNYWAPTLEN